MKQYSKSFCVITFLWLFFISLDQAHSAPRHVSLSQRNKSLWLPFAIIADLDKESKVLDKNDTYRSFIKIGVLNMYPDNRITINWNGTQPLIVDSHYAYNGRGSELSELLSFKDKLLTFDDRTGIIYEVEGDVLVPWAILSDGDGNEAKGFKTEWATIKDNHVYAGSTGMEWYSRETREVLNHFRMFVKQVSYDGEVHHQNWFREYNAMRQAAGMSFPGFIWHEAGIWSDWHQKWFFLPRKCSAEKFDYISSENIGCNLIIAANGNFTNIEVTPINSNIDDPGRGFSSLKFLPNNNNVLVALKTKEQGNSTVTYLTVLKLDGTVLLPDQKIIDAKYEGLEFI